MNTERSPSSTSSSSSSSSEFDYDDPPGCFRRVFLSPKASKIYLSLALTVGIVGLLMMMIAGAVYGFDDLLYIFLAFVAHYVLAQVIGLIGLFTKRTAFFIPYEVMMVIALAFNIWVLVLPLYGMFVACDEDPSKHEIGCQTPNFDPFTLTITTFPILVLNCLCVFGVVNVHCDGFEQEEDDEQGNC